MTSVAQSALLALRFGGDVLGSGAPAILGGLCGESSIILHSL